MEAETKPDKPVNQWGFTSKTKWALFETAPYTASALNEIIATARTRSECTAIAKLLGKQVTVNGRYQVIDARKLRGHG